MVPWQFAALESSRLRGAVEPHAPATKPRVALMQTRAAHRDVDNESDDESDYDDDESSADKQLARMHLNELMGYSSQEAEDDERSGIENTAEDVKDDADDEAAVEEVVEEEHQGDSEDTEDTDGDRTATLLQNQEVVTDDGHQHINLEDAISLKALQWSTDATKGTSDDEASDRDPQDATSTGADDADEEAEPKIDADAEVDRVELEDMLRSSSDPGALLQRDQSGDDEGSNEDEVSDEDGEDESIGEEEVESEEMESGAEEDASSDDDDDDVDEMHAQGESTDDNFSDTMEDDSSEGEDGDATSEGAAF